jgi:transposase
VIDVMTRSKIHHLSEAGVLQSEIAVQCGVGLRSVERVLGEPPPNFAELQSGRASSRKQGRPPKADDAMLERIRLLLENEPTLPATEVLRRAREWGFRGGRSQTAALVKKLRPKPRKEPIVRFDGLPAEYAQFDFGECVVPFACTGKERVQFFAGRLKFSRYMHVVLVPDQQAETLVRSLFACLVEFGGSPKEWVFDNPRTIRISPIGVHPIVLHRFVRQAVAECRVIPTLCAPRSGNQKGSVERLVGFVKNSFLLVRRFRDFDDLQTQLAEWLHEVNHVRLCDATRRIPAEMLAEEATLLGQRPVRCSPEAWAIEETATVTPMGTITYRGTSYSATARYLGAPATLQVRKRTIDIRVGDERCEHRREDHTREVRRLPAHREDVLAVLHGQRKLATFRRQCLLELGQPAWQFLGQLVHRCPQGRWEKPCSDLYDLLTRHGDGAMLDAFTRCVARSKFTVDAVRAVLKEAA